LASWGRQRSRTAHGRAKPPIRIVYRNNDGVECPPNAKQLIAHATAAEQIFYGGAAGGGKSIWLVVALVGYAAIKANVQVAIFRRHYKELHQSIVPMVLSMLPKGSYRFDKQLGMLTFLHNNSIVWFLHCARDSDVILYQSSNWRKLGIDEASHMTQFIVDYLTTRVRGDWRDAQVLLGSNPGGAGHGWLKRRFVRPAGWDVNGPFAGGRPSPRPLEVWRPYPPKEKPDQYMMSRVFIPAFVQDNVEMVKADPHYFDRILALGGAKAQQLAYGDWDSNDGMMFGPDWRAEHIVSSDDTKLRTLGFHEQQIIPWHVIPRTDWRPPQAATTYASVDYGYGAPWSFHLHAILPGGHIRTFFEFYKAGVRDRQQAEMIREAIGRLMGPASEGGCHMQRPTWLVYDPQMDNDRSEVGLTQSISDVYKEVLTESQLQLQLIAGARSSRKSRIQRTKDALAPTDDDGLPWWQVTAACENLIRTLPELPVDEDDAEAIDEDAEDHAWEECGRFLEHRPIPPRARPYSELDELDPISRAEQLGVLTRRDGLVTVTPLQVQNIIPG
jgi:hypothetical protein